MSDGGEAREQTRGHLDVVSADAAGERRAPEASVPWCSRASRTTIVAVALGAAAVGGLGVWLYLRAGGSPQNRASHRIEELRHQLDDIADRLVRHTGEGEPGEHSGGS